MLKPCDPSQIIRKVNRVVVARREIRAVRRVVKQLPVEVLQQYSSASKFMRTRIFIGEH
jgi:hypothetical protein